MTTKKDSSKAGKLVRKLFAEAMQTERSARTHPAKEAKRLGASPPALAFLAVSKHAKASEEELRKLARARGCGTSRLGLFFGNLFSISRNRVADAALDTERSYRATLLGMHHGVDLFTIFGAAAEEAGDEELAAWCRAWLKERRPLVDGAVAALDWLAAHAGVAMADAKASFEKKKRE